MKKFFISRSQRERMDFINGIEGKKIVIYNKPSELIKLFDYAIDMNQLMKNDYFFDNIVNCDKKTTLVLLDVLIKNGVYVHPYGKIFRFTEVARETLIIDTFMFKFDEKHIVRPFLFIDTSVFGTSMLGFHADESNTVENYYTRIAEYIDCRVKEIKCKVIKFIPTENEIKEYERIKEKLIFKDKAIKSKIVNELIKYVDNLPSKIHAIKEYKGSDKSLTVKSNNPKSKFFVYNTIQEKNKVNEIVFFSSGTFGADEIELSKCKLAIDRHNKLIKLLRSHEKIQ